MEAAGDAFSNCNRLDKLLDIVFRHTLDLSQRADLFAETLRWLVPGAPLYLCFLKNRSESHLSLFDERARPRGDWLGHFPAASLLSAASTEGTTSFLPVPAALGLQQQRLAVQPLIYRQRWHGLLALSVPDSLCTPQSADHVRLLGICARQMALRQELERRDEEYLGVVQELGKQAKAANYGDWVRTLGHEFNNFLNVLLLQVAVLEQELPERANDDLAELRKHGKKLAETMQQLQRFRQQQAVLRPMPLNVSLRNALQKTNWPVQSKRGLSTYLLPINQRTELEQAAEELTLSLSLEAEAAQVVASLPDLEELCASLLNLAIAAADASKCSLLLRTESHPNRVVIELEEVRKSPLEAQATKRTNNRSRLPPKLPLEASSAFPQVAANLCESFVQRLFGRFHHHSHSAGGWLYHIELPVYRDANANDAIVVEATQKLPTGLRA